MSVLFRNVYAYPAVDRLTDVLVEGNRITAIGAGLHQNADRIIDGHGHHLLVPGLINAHFHSPANHLKGSLPSLPLELFMLYESPATEALRPTPREAYLRTMLGAIEMVRTGTTSVQDDAFLMPYPEPEIIDAVMQAYADSGLRATVALDQPEVPEGAKLPFRDPSAELAAELRKPAPLPAAELLARYEYLISRWHGAEGGRLGAAVSISAPQRVTPDYFAALDDLSRRHRLPLYAHMLETRVQRTLAAEKHGGRSLVRYTADLDLLSDRMNIIHAVWTDEDDWDLIAAAGSIVAHNPVSNLRLGSGIMPFRAIRDRGIPVCLGVDEAICDDAVNMWGVVKMAGLIHNVTGLDSDRWPAATEVLDCLWDGGAAAMLRDDLGRIAPGHLADLALLDLHGIAFTPLNDVPGQLVYCESGTDVALTMVDGRIVAERGRMVGVDEDALLAEAREVFAAKAPALAAARADAGRWFPEYQQMVRRAAATDVGMTR
ncbi:amidohydrolase family protein [Paractinoplanes durhamensis]|uniref:5-methylthioadenosine/S-adenosylhomocysteine deaminase n=1 Tax=Paractinoplanes durhamensis TaxID=113563 RepID=A0ABQ3YVA4_9ACTN|nr:amidohydrolase family protein [Actinoplanes durhamensis]GIE01493.1 5-methylthioadenosine/S-adenosylhomocysteine deaminase [Actinoplanes durhamensis]